MIFVTLGTNKPKFNRLLEKIDFLIAEKNINDEVLAQVGFSDYKPANYNTVTFLDPQDYKKIIIESGYVITHGGTGSVISALKENKKTIAIPRLAKYNEHLNDHQIEIVSKLEEMGHLLACYDLEKLNTVIDLIDEFKPVPFVSNTDNFILILKDFLRRKIL